jgi:hypothetical protein
MAWLAGWSYRKSLILSRASGVVTNYQMKLLVSESTSALSESCYKAVFTMTASGNSYQYNDMTGVTNYTIQSGDYLEYDIYCTNAGDYVGFDYTCTDSTTLRDSGTVDQNGVTFHPAGDISAYAVNTWYHRKGALPVGHVGKTISYFDIACECDTSATKTIYIKNILITNGSGAVRKTILVGTEMSVATASHNSSNGALTSFALQIGAACQSDFDDIRFTNSDGTTLLDYWIESISGTTPNQIATIWVEFDSIGTTDTTFYMYYGNSSATAYSNGPNTFLFFDDFSGTLSDKWSVGGSCVNSGGICTITRTGGVDASISSWSSFATNTRWRSRLKSLHSNNSSYVESFGLSNATGPNYYRAYYCYSLYNLKYTQYAPSTWNAGTAIGGWAADTYAIQEVKRNGTTSTISSVNDANEVTISANVPTGNMYCNIDAVVYNGSIMYTDWVFCSQWLVTEPAWTSWGVQEQSFLSRGLYLGIGRGILRG